MCTAKDIIKNFLGCFSADNLIWKNYYFNARKLLDESDGKEKGIRKETMDKIS